MFQLEHLNFLDGIAREHRVPQGPFIAGRIRRIQSRLFLVDGHAVLIMDLLEAEDHGVDLKLLVPEGVIHF